MKYLKQNAVCISWCTRWARKPHAKKAAVHYAVHFLSRGNLKNLMPRFFTFCVPALLMQFQAQ